MKYNTGGEEDQRNNTKLIFFPINDEDQPNNIYMLDLPPLFWLWDLQREKKSNEFNINYYLK